MQQFLASNWLSILSIFIGIVVAYIFYRLQKKDSASASMERKKHARAELLDVIESYIINKQYLSESVIDNLTHASERDRLVVLRPGCTAVSLLQDVGLRLQRSRHLDIPQKSEYSEKIEKLISEIRQNRNLIRTTELQDELSTKLLELQQLIPAENREEAQQVLSAVASLVQQQKELAIRMEERKERMMVSTTALFGVTAAAATALIGTRVFENVAGSPVTLIASKMFPILGTTLAVVVAMQALVTTIRIKRRSHNKKRGDRQT